MSTRRRDDFASLSILPFEQRALRAQLGGVVAARKRLERQPLTPENAARIETLRLREENIRRTKRASRGDFEYIPLEIEPEPTIIDYIEEPVIRGPVYMVCEVTKYFEVRVKNPRRTPRMRFEVRAELTLPSDIVESREGESRSEWENRVSRYLEDRVEPIFDSALDRWGNGIRRVRLSDGRVEMYQNVLNLDDYRKGFRFGGVLGIETFEGTDNFRNNVTFEIAKYKEDHLDLLQPQDMNVRESELM